MLELQNKGLTMKEAHKTNSEVDIRSNGTISGFMNRKYTASSELQINPSLSDKDKGFLPFESRRYMAEILPIRRKTLSNQSIQTKLDLAEEIKCWFLTRKLQRKTLRKKNHFWFIVKNIAHEWFTNQVIIEGNKYVLQIIKHKGGKWEGSGSSSATNNSCWEKR